MENSSSGNPSKAERKSSVEKNEDGIEFLKDIEWRKMDVASSGLYDRSKQWLSEKIDNALGQHSHEEGLRVLWLSGTLLFIVGGYWLLRSLKDPIMSVTVGVDRIPQAKMLSVLVVLVLVVIYNKLVDLFPKHQLFYVIGGFYACLFGGIALLLAHPTIGLANTDVDPSRLIGWVSYLTIESFGSIVVQLFWAYVNSSVDLNFAKKNFGKLFAGAQIGSILGPTLAASHADSIGIPTLYAIGSLCMLMMIMMVYGYHSKFGDSSGSGSSHPKSEKEGIMEGIHLFVKHDYVKGIFAVSCVFMIQVTILDYMLKYLAKQHYDDMYPDDPSKAVSAFAAFTGHFGQVTNSISFLFSLFGTSFIIQRAGLNMTLSSFFVCCLISVVVVFISPTLWVVFSVMMIIKGLSYALNNPCKEMLYQPTSTPIKFKCKSWIETFGARSCKATGSIVTNMFANNLTDLNTYGSLVGVCLSIWLIWTSRWMGNKFDEYVADGFKLGDNDGDDVSSGSSGAAAAANEKHVTFKAVEMIETNKNADQDDGGTSCMSEKDSLPLEACGKELKI